ncbi:MAG: hypothetical protein ACYST2_06815 [Planctomycetota bacterium]|jgi:hypothetical protein
MVEQKFKLDVLRADIREAVNDFSERLLKALGENLKSITVVGSSLTEDFIKGKSDINTVLVLGERNRDGQRDEQEEPFSAAVDDTGVYRQFAGCFRC